MIAMHGPNGAYESANETREKELRAIGWIDGHEYFTKVNAGKDPFPIESDESFTASKILTDVALKRRGRK